MMQRPIENDSVSGDLHTCVRVGVKGAINYVCLSTLPCDAVTLIVNL